MLHFMNRILQSSEVEKTEIFNYDIRQNERKKDSDEKREINTHSASQKTKTSKWSKQLQLKIVVLPINCLGI